MMAFLRSLAATLLVLASPGVGGVVLPTVHQCPMAAAGGWRQPEAPVDAHAGHHGAPTPAGQSQHQDCRCIGPCCPVALAAAPKASDVLRVRANLVVVEMGPVIRRVLPVSRPLDLLPPPTAPPQA